jgi:cysteinyl-tRNA synthetase
MLRIHNSLTRRKEDFAPIEPGKVRMYVCGITVYDHCHVGHARMMLVFDMVARWLRASGFALTYVRNITDIDDKIIRRAIENGETIGALTERFITAMHQDLDALGVLRPDHEPRATQYVPQMLNLIGLLEQNGLAYRAADGDVNFSVRKFAPYGRLSGKSLDELRAGERVAVTDAKQDPLDFVLWKASKDADPQEARWPSTYGSGRPGWHIECSAMATALLGESLDIHGGGADLQFPHHENEIAQSEGAHPGTFVRYWMHNGFVRVDDEKMSKSLGNFFTIREVMGQFDAEVLRLFVLRAHYRSPLNYSDAHLEDARASLLRLYTALTPGVHAPAEVDWSAPDLFVSLWTATISRVRRDGEAGHGAAAERMPIRPRPGHRGMAHRARGTRAVIHHEAATELRRQRLGHQAAHEIGRTTRRPGDHDGDGPAARKGLLRGGGQGEKPQACGKLTA